MTYREFFSHVVDVVEGVGATILVVGGLGAVRPLRVRHARRVEIAMPSVSCAGTSGE